MTKTSIIREYLAKFPEIGPKALVAQIRAETSVKKLTPAEVSGVKTKMRKEGLVPETTPHQTRPSTNHSTTEVHNLTYFTNARQMVKDLGYEVAQKILEAAR